MNEMPKLTDRFLKDLAPEGGRKDRLVFDTESKGLGVRVTAAGAKTSTANTAAAPITTQRTVHSMEMRPPAPRFINNSF